MILIKREKVQEVVKNILDKNNENSIIKSHWQCEIVFTTIKLQFTNNNQNGTRTFATCDFLQDLIYNNALMKNNNLGQTQKYNFKLAS